MKMYAEIQCMSQQSPSVGVIGQCICKNVKIIVEYRVTKLHQW
jgi:hypothetical protein